MGKMTLEELRALRGSVKSDLARRDSDGKSVQIIVGMGTCGIAAGAKATLDAFIKELDAKGLADSTIIRQTGCMGLQVSLLVIRTSSVPVQVPWSVPCGSTDL